MDVDEVDALKAPESFQEWYGRTHKRVRASVVAAPLWPPTVGSAGLTPLYHLCGPELGSVWESGVVGMAHCPLHFVTPDSEVPHKPVHLDDPLGCAHSRWSLDVAPPRVVDRSQPVVAWCWGTPRDKERAGVSDTSQGDGWWRASDGKWYPPESAQQDQKPPPPARAAASSTGAAATDRSVEEHGGGFLKKPLPIWALLVTALVALFVGVGIGGADDDQQDEIGDLRADNADLEDEVSDLEETASSLKEESENLTSQVSALTAEVDELKEAATTTTSTTTTTTTTSTTAPPPTEAPAAAPPPSEDPTPAPASVYFENCDAARAAGAAPVRRGDPGYAPHLDGDNDGIGCE